jgi:hypothetical protein
MRASHLSLQCILWRQPQALKGVSLLEEMHALLEQVPQHGAITLSVVHTDDSTAATATPTPSTATAAAPHSKADSVPCLPAAGGAGFDSYILM